MMMMYVWTGRVGYGILVGFQYLENFKNLEKKTFSCRHTEGGTMLNTSALTNDGNKLLLDCCAEFIKNETSVSKVKLQPICDANLITFDLNELF